MRLLATALLVALAACSGGDDGPERLTSEVPLREPVVAGEVLVSVAGTFLHPRVVASSDGKTWSDVDLPAGPIDPGLASVELRRTGDLVVVTGNGTYVGADLTGPPPASYLWTTVDGERWEGGVLSGGVTISTPPDVFAADDGIVVGQTVGGTFRLWRVEGGEAVATRIDGLALRPGESGHLVNVWRVADRWRAQVAFRQRTDRGFDRVVLESSDLLRWSAVDCDVGCDSVRRAGRLLVAGERVSLDEGRTWQVAHLEPPPPQRARPAFVSVVEDGRGGWLGVTATNDTRLDTGVLMRSDDGVRWRAIDGTQCEGGIGTYVELGRPIRHGERWLVSRTCTGIGSADRADLFVVEGDRARSVLGEPRRRFGQPFRWRARVGVPVLHGDGRGLLAIEVLDG